MAPRIFMTGISGYIGGQVLHDITKRHPEYLIRGLVRTNEQQEKIAAKYPSVQTVIGDLDSADVLKAEATLADVVLRKYQYHYCRIPRTADKNSRISRFRPHARYYLSPPIAPQSINIYPTLWRSFRLHRQ
jgi:N-acetyl-gamma-glutamylphosphate reductase